MKHGLVIAANRLPIHRVEGGGRSGWQISPGGLVTAMAPILRRRGGHWIGWNGSVTRAGKSFDIDDLSLSPIGLSRSESLLYYQGFSNSTLWPLYHDAIVIPELHRTWWRSYKAVNQRFAKRLAQVTKRRGVVWVHDYHLQLVPGLLRKLRPDLRIGFFLHIPFPPEELFAWLPWREAILAGLLGANVIGFQTEASSQNFSRAARRWTAAEGTDRELTFHEQAVRVRPAPIAIDADEFAQLAEDPRVQERAAEIRASLGNRTLFLGVDRLDYTKGIPHRLRAFEELLRERRLNADDVALVQVAVPSREDAPGYAEVRREVEETVGRINGQFSEPGKVAVHYFRRNLPRDELVAYYLAANVMLVTPLRDGMNLVAKEFVACRHDYGGMLVLSEFAGAASELRRALLVNPRDIDAMKTTMLRAIRMPERERRMRMAILRTQVRRHDVHEWASSFLEALS
ncbi:MAG TPA: trehalose-6-phosphate synthase [Phycisphaerales bacterium]|nr:trehalose-6-phosphate synthase [Phycisphaerales bacterium]